MSQAKNNRKCYYCGQKLVEYTCSRSHPVPPDNGYTRDHIDPRANGGSGKTVACCFKCNRDKGMLSAEEFRAVLALRSGRLTMPNFVFFGEKDGNNSVTCETP